MTDRDVRRTSRIGNDPAIVDVIQEFIQREVGSGYSEMIRSQAWDFLVFLRANGVTVSTDQPLHDG